MIIVSWNVNGIRAVHKKGLLLPFIERYRPDFLCLQETKAAPEENPVDLSEYHEVWNSASRKGYSGTAIFSNTPPLSVSRNLPEPLLQRFKIGNDGYGNPNEEGRVIAAEFAQFFLVTVYTPNAKDDLSRIPLRLKWDPAFLEYVKGLEKKKPVIFCGDLNVAHTEDDLARPKENVGKKGFTEEERAGVNAFVEAGFVDTFRLFTKGSGHYTWWSHFAKARERNVGWRIDYIFVSNQIAKKVMAAKILPEVLGSDHCPTLSDIDL